MPDIGVLLSGCGVFDGSEIHEAVLTLLALDKRGATIVCCAPNIEFDTVNHLTKQPTGERRNVLTESARIARGEVRDLATVTADQLDALILPGGFGAARNLSTFAVHGSDCTVNPDVQRLVGECLEARKPVGAICIAPATLAKIVANCGLKANITIGNDPGTAKAIVALGHTHENQPVDGIAIDEDNRIVTTPAYMLGPGPAAISAGIDKLVAQVLAMV